ncbi:MAG TPA: nucleoside deaminase [Myxococcales bacterium]|nr:nucleoside deaminase [Myxococcales bacterium]
MQSAIAEALAGRREGGIPIGSVLVIDDRIVGRGRNRRVQQGDSILHAEIDCLRNAGRIRDYRRSTLYSTLMPCYLCAGAVVQFGIPRVVVGEARNFAGAADFMRRHGATVTDLDLDECAAMLGDFIREHPSLWNEDIGVP